MADKIHTLTDEKLEEMEKKISAIYSRALKEVQETADNYFKHFEKADKHKAELVEKGELSKEEYLNWRKNKILYGKRFTELKEQLAKQLLNVNKTAMAYINGELPEIYVLNYNDLANKVDGLNGYSFTLVDEETIKNLAISDKTLLPYKYVDGVKDIRWNTQKINAEILQGILQGDSMDKIAKRLQKVTEMNKVSAIRNARTSVTSAENKGRYDSQKKAEKDGIIIERKWRAAMDGRTRHTHAMLNGEIRGTDEAFSNGLMYPADPNGRPSEVYNCRCTIVPKVIGFK